MPDFFRKQGLILSEAFLYVETNKNLEKKSMSTVQKNSSFWEGLTLETGFF